MHAVLPRRSSDVHAYVIAVGTVALFHDRARRGQQVHDGNALVVRHIEESRDVAARNHQRVACTHRIVIGTRIGERILAKDVARLA